MQKKFMSRGVLPIRQLVVLGAFLLLTGVVFSRGATAAVDGTDLFLPLVMRPVPEANQIALQRFAIMPADAVITDIASAGDDRLFVADRTGKIYVVKANGTVLGTPFLDISSGYDLATGNWEEGLVGLVFHPDYAENGYFYVTFTTTGFVRIGRFTVSANNPNVADASSFKAIHTRIKPTVVHHGGDLAFGPDGYLYISTGDGGPDPLPFSDPDAFPGDPQNRSQSLSNTYGSILRLDVDNPNGFWQEDCQFSGGDNPDAYSIPVDNPHVNGPGGPCDEVWANGLRNPWRFSFDRLTGDMYIADVGEWIHEEVNFVPAGAPGGRNFGWHCFEGTTDYTTVWPQVAGDCGAPPYTPPVAEYMHQQGACSITGGFVYRGSEQPGLFGWYVFADFCNGHFWRMNATNGWQPVELAFTGDFISTFGEDANGELFVGTWVPPFGNGGSIYRVVVP